MIQDEKKSILEKKICSWFLKHDLYNFGVPLCVWASCLGGWACTTCIKCSWGPDEGRGSPGAGVKDGWALYKSSKCSSQLSPLSSPHCAASAQAKSASSQGFNQNQSQANGRKSTAAVSGTLKSQLRIRGLSDPAGCSSHTGVSWVTAGQAEEPESRTVSEVHNNLSSQKNKRAFILEPLRDHGLGTQS